MLGWTFLLIWADRKPIERSDVLILTVSAMLIIGVLHFIGFLNNNRYISLGSLLSNSTIILFGLSYYFARSFDNKGKD